jgi:hypothetical protein
MPVTPQWMPLVAAASIRPSICFTVEDSTPTKEGVSSDLSSTSPRSGWLNSEGFGARLALPEVARQPLLDGRPDGLGHPPTQEQGRGPSSKKPQDVNTTLLTPGTWQPFLPQHPLGKRQRAGARVWTGRPETPLPRAWITAWPPCCGIPLERGHVVPVIVIHSSKLLRLKRISSSTRRSYYSSTATRHCLVVAALADRLTNFS